MWSMPVRTSSTLSRVSVLQPAAVVLEGALPGGRVVGHHLGDELRIVADLADDPVGEHLAGELVHLADRPLLVGIVGIDPGRLEALVASGPEDEEPVPAPVEGQVTQRPPHARPHRRVVVRVREHPLRGPLEDGQMPHVGGDGRGDLEPAGPGADHGHPLAGEVDRVVPAGRVEGRPGEALLAGDVGDVRPVQLPDGGDHGPGHERRLGAVIGPDP